MRLEEFKFFASADNTLTLGQLVAKSVGNYRVSISRHPRGGVREYTVVISKNTRSDLVLISFSSAGKNEAFPEKALPLRERWDSVYEVMEDFFDLSEQEFIEVLDRLDFRRSGRS